MNRYMERVEHYAKIHAKVCGDKYQWPHKVKWQKYKMHGESTCRAVAESISSLLDDMGWNSLDIQALLIDNGYVPKPE